MNLNSLLDQAKIAASMASEEILKVYRSDDFEIKAKNDQSPLTRADHAAHQVIASILEETDIPILSEDCLLYTSPSPRDVEESRMPSSA